METTVEDFWRMIVEHNICTMVQLSADDGPGGRSPTIDLTGSADKNGGKFKYWPVSDTPASETDYGAMKVTLISKESLPSYIKREFTVYNAKTEEEVHLSHFAYSGWNSKSKIGAVSPSAGEESDEKMPESTYGLLDLVEHAMAHKIEASLPGPIAVHCK